MMCFVGYRPLFNVGIYMEISNERLKLILSVPYICSEKCGVGKRSTKDQSVSMKIKCRRKEKLRILLSIVKQPAISWGHGGVLIGSI